MDFSIRQHHLITIIQIHKVLHHLRIQWIIMANTYKITVSITVEEMAITFHRIRLSIMAEWMETIHMVDNIIVLHRF